MSIAAVLRRRFWIFALVVGLLDLGIPDRAYAVCTTTETAHCLQGNRFKVEIEWLDYVGNGGLAQTVGEGTSDSGLFWFYGPDNWEVLVKVLNGCQQNNRYWVFAAAATTLQYRIIVQDTATGEMNEYLNPLDVSSPAITDIEAFATCAGNAVPPTPTRTPAPTMTPTRTPPPVFNPPPPACCRHCTTGKPCGNSCINRNLTCHQPPGCAC